MGDITGSNRESRLGKNEVLEREMGTLENSDVDIIPWVHFEERNNWQRISECSSSDSECRQHIYRDLGCKLSLSSFFLFVCCLSVFLQELALSTLL